MKNYKFGVREICDVVFKANQTGKIGTMSVSKGQPVLYIDSAKTSTIEGASTTVYATGGKGNARLISWEGEKTLTFTVEDALLSPVGFHILSGAGLFDVEDEGKTAYVHTTAIANIVGNKIDLSTSLADGEYIAKNAPIFVLPYVDGSISGQPITYIPVSEDNVQEITISGETSVEQAFVDFYIAKTSKVTELQIDAENFAGFYYVEASTLYRRESDGRDLPAEIVFPKVKIQSNFTFSMASSGDPSTFTFTMDAMPGYTFFNKTKKVLCAMQVIDDSASDEDRQPVTMNKGIGGDIVEENNNSNAKMIKLNHKALTLVKGDSFTLSALVTNAEATDTIAWTVTPESSIASIPKNEGSTNYCKVTADGKGEAVVTATIIGTDIKDTCVITVIDPNVATEEE